MNIFFTKETRQKKYNDMIGVGVNLPDESGVYLFKKNKDILYIGKATSLKDRVRSYFSNDLIAARGQFIVDMIFQADSVEFIKTDSVLEALILESNLIKKYQPRFNTKEKDDRSYNYVVITKEDFPKIMIIRERELAGGKRLNLKNSKRFNLEEPEYKATFGPFTNGTQLKEALKIVRKIFPFLDKYSKPKTGYGFYREIGLAPDVSSVEAKKDYAKNIKNISLFFSGKKISIVKNLEKEMKIFAKNQEFEKADKIKRTIFALNHIQDVALIKEDSSRQDLVENGFRVEAYDVAHISGTNTVGVMTVVENGIVNKAEYRKFKINPHTFHGFTKFDQPKFKHKSVKEHISSSANQSNQVQNEAMKGVGVNESIQNDVAGLGEILRRRFNHPEWKFPDIIVVDGSTAQKNIAEKILKEKGIQSIVVAVTKDERHRPKAIQGREDVIHKYESEILLANSEAHRFAIKYHREKRGKII